MDEGDFKLGEDFLGQALGLGFGTLHQEGINLFRIRLINPWADYIDLSAGGKLLLNLPGRGMSRFICKCLKR